MQTANVLLRLGRWATEEGLDSFIRTAAGIASRAERIDYISRQFLDVPYRHPTLVGSLDVQEQFVVNLESVDCFTYLDYVEAMRLAHSFDDFLENLAQVRYEGGVIAYDKRRHFFTDWIDSGCIEDVTAEVGGSSTRTITKTLNVKSDGSLFLHGIRRVMRVLSVAPAGIDRIEIDKLRNGDYVGIYAETEGLDVSHVGIAIRDKESGALVFRHASSTQGKVVDQDLNEYLASKSGIIVLKPRA